jgi:hypothetical protein
MELAGLEPETPWVRSSRRPTPKCLYCSVLSTSPPERRNIFRNSLYPRLAERRPDRAGFRGRRLRLFEIREPLPRGAARQLTSERGVARRSGSAGV